MLTYWYDNNPCAWDAAMLAFCRQAGTVCVHVGSPERDWTMAARFRDRIPGLHMGIAIGPWCERNYPPEDLSDLIPQLELYAAKFARFKTLAGRRSVAAMVDYEPLDSRWCVEEMSPAGLLAVELRLRSLALLWHAVFPGQPIYWYDDGMAVPVDLPTTHYTRWPGRWLPDDGIGSQFACPHVYRLSDIPGTRLQYAATFANGRPTVPYVRLGTSEEDGFDAQYPLRNSTLAGEMLQACPAVVLYGRPGYVPWFYTHWAAFRSGFSTIPDTEANHV